MSEVRHQSDSQRGGTKHEPDSSPAVTLYTEADIKAARQFVSAAAPMLGALEIDHKPGISRAEILQAEKNKHLSDQDRKVLAGLNSLEPSVQDAWQVPGHRAHLRASAQAADWHWEAQGRKKFDPDWAARLNKAADRLEAKSGPGLKADALEQNRVYWHMGAVSGDKLSSLKGEINRVEVAVKVLHNDAKTALHLVQKYGGADGKLSLAEMQKALAGKNLPFADRVVLGGLADIQTGYGDQSALNKDSVQFLVGQWAVGEARADSGNKEQLFFHALDGYKNGQEGRGFDIRTDARLRREMEAKDAGQFDAYYRNFQQTRPPIL